MAHFAEYKTSDFFTSCWKGVAAARKWQHYMEPAASETPVGYIQEMFEDKNGFDLHESLQVLLPTEGKRGIFGTVREKRNNTMDMLREQAFRIRKELQRLLDKLM